MVFNSGNYYICNNVLPSNLINNNMKYNQVDRDLFIDNDGNVYSIDRTVLLDIGEGVTELAVPDNVKSIAAEAGVDKDNLRLLRIPDSVMSIGEWAFSGCRMLQTLRMPHLIEDIPSGVFHACDWLKYVRIPETVKTIGQGAFSDCKHLTDIRFAGVPEAIAPLAFSECPNLSAIYIPRGHMGHFRKLLPWFDQQIIEE